MAHVKVFILYPTILVLSKIASKSYKKNRYYWHRKVLFYKNSNCFHRFPRFLKITDPAEHKYFCILNIKLCQKYLFGILITQNKLIIKRQGIQYYTEYNRESDPSNCKKKVSLFYITANNKSC